jgi:hypothetical protein
MGTDVFQSGIGVIYINPQDFDQHRVQALPVPPL